MLWKWKGGPFKKKKSQCIDLRVGFMVVGGMCIFVWRLGKGGILGCFISKGVVQKRVFYKGVKDNEGKQVVFGSVY